MLTAALDAARLGARAPLSADLLRAAAPGYCTSQQQAEAPGNWFEQALAYATGKLHGAAAALSPAGAGMGQLTGYTAADYLIQHASRERRYARVPASTWDALLSHIRDPADAARLADSARSRLLYCYAIPLYRHAADAGDEHAASQLAGLLAERGDLDRAARPGRRRRRGRRLSAGRPAGRPRRPGRAARPGRRRRRARRLRLAGLLADRGDLDELRARADAGDGHAASRLAGCWPTAATWTSCAPGPTPATGTPPGGWPACWPTAATWTSCAPGPTPATGMPPCGWPACWPPAGTWTRPCRSCAPGPTPATSTPPCGWPTCWPPAGDLDEAVQILRARPTPATGTPPSGWPTCWPTAGTWTSCAPGPTPATGTPPRGWPGCWPTAGTWTSCAPGPTPATGTPPSSWPGCWPTAATWTELRARADAGDWFAAVRLADLLAERGDLDELRARADTGDGYAAGQLAGLLAERGDLDELRARADTGDEYAASRLAGLLTKQGRNEEAERLRRFGLNPDGSIAYE